MATKEFMDVDFIKENLDKNDTYSIKDWYEEYVCAGTEFERMADALFDVNENEFLYQVADYISDEFYGDGDDFVEIIKDNNWDWELTPLQEFEYDTKDSYVDFVTCKVRYADTGEETEMVLAVGLTAEELDDEDNDYLYSSEDIAFFYDNLDEVRDLFVNGGDDWEIVEYISFE